jgi:RNA polymerase sigma-70 factor (ECF subfamily)
MLKYLPTAVVQLNRVAAVSFADGPLAGLMQLDQLGLEQELSQYHHYHATRADFLRRLGEFELARAAYTQAIVLCTNEREQHFLRKRVADL